MSYTLSELLLDESFVRYVKGKASTEEKVRWDSWVQQDEEHEAIARKAEKLLDKGFVDLQSGDAEAELKRLKRRIQLPRYSKPFLTGKKQQKKMAWAMLATAASILFVVGLTAWLVLSQNDGTNPSQADSIVYQTVTTNYGERTSISYSDGSRIVLNANSTLRLPENVAAQRSIEVWLQGEGYFNIDRKPESNPREFIVHTPTGKITVLGTRFAVSTIGEGTRVALAEGRVRLTGRDTLELGTLAYEMAPGELATLSPRYAEILVTQVNPDVYTSWASDSLILDRTPLSELVRRIEDTYGVKVEVDNRDLLKEKLTGKLRNVGLDVLLKGLAKTLGVEIERIDNTIHIRE